MTDERQAYTVAACATCDVEGDTALVVRPGRYVCARCRGTGTWTEGSLANVADAVPDAELVAVFEEALAHSASLYEFETLAKVYRPRLRSV